MAFLKKFTFWINIYDFPFQIILIKSDFVFLNEPKSIILTIYDDRGCDIWSDNLTIQKEFYHKYNSWILDYDRETINKNISAFPD